MGTRIDVRLARLCAAARNSKRVHDNDCAARDAAIAEADQLGLEVRDIWERTGVDNADRLALSHVHRIVLREAAKRQTW